MAKFTMPLAVRSINIEMWGTAAGNFRTEHMVEVQKPERAT